MFEFDKNQVSVFGKDGFPTDDLLREISFRRSYEASFVPCILKSDADGYTEQIIDGSPVARMGQKTKPLCDRAFDIWSEYIKPHTKEIPAAEYAGMLAQKLEELEKRAAGNGKNIKTAALQSLTKALLAVLLEEDALIPVSLSHGDLQAGNIWVENGTEKLYIIDWESWQNRSIWYDQATLYENLRRTDGIAAYAKQTDLIHATVLLEDILFRLTELNSLPHDYGCGEFDTYIKVLLGEKADV